MSFSDPELHGDIAWMLAATALVLLMTPGIGFFYGGLVNRKNAYTIVIQSILVMCLAGTIWPILAYSLAFGPSMLGGLIGNFDYVALQNTWNHAGLKIPSQLDMIFECTFAIVAAALVIGGFAERLKLSAFCLFIPLWILFVYCPVAHWLWGNHLGENTFFSLKNKGTLDFAGGMVVHLNAGVAAFVAGCVIGPRAEYKSKKSSVTHLHFCLLGVSLIWFGWLGFNAGSAGAANEVAATALVNTIFAAAMGGLAWVAIEYIRSKHITAPGLAAGVVAGLVAITPACGFVQPMSSLAIGALASGVSYTAMYIINERFRCDDSLDVFSVHGMSAIWGALATGLFATLAVNPEGDNGLFYGNASQLFDQLRGILYVLIWSGGVSFLLLKLIDWSIGLRCHPDHETLGLDSAQFGLKSNTSSSDP